MVTHKRKLVNFFSFKKANSKGYLSVLKANYLLETMIKLANN